MNNDFNVINNTSFYRETLLGTSGLPLRNWGLIFKPQVWAFFIVSPAFAYSIYWAIQFVAFLCGWSMLLRRLGFRATTAAITSVVLFLSPFVQLGGPASGSSSHCFHGLSGSWSPCGRMFV